MSMGLPAEPHGHCYSAAINYAMHKEMCCIVHGVESVATAASHRICMVELYKVRLTPPRCAYGHRAESCIGDAL